MASCAPERAGQGGGDPGGPPILHQGDAPMTPEEFTAARKADHGRAIIPITALKERAGGRTPMGRHHTGSVKSLYAGNSAVHLDSRGECSFRRDDPFEGTFISDYHREWRRP